MLQHMFVGDPPGNYDRILDFSTAVTGTLFFVPTADFLDDPPRATRPHSPPRSSTHVAGTCAIPAATVRCGSAA